jgi:hypothetical protein
MKKATRYVFLAVLMVFFLSSNVFSGSVPGDVSISVIKKGAEPPSGCLLKQKATNLFSSARVSATQYGSTIYICSEASCSDIEVSLDGLWHDSYLSCDNILNFSNVPAGYSYRMYAESSNCNTYWEYDFFLEEGNDDLIWLCPSEEIACCNQGCADDGSYNCDTCNGGCFAASVTNDKTVLSNLRQFRDYLAKNFIGQKIVTLYYKVSPTAIKIVNKVPFLKTAAQKILEIIAK